jgi:phosphomevalonate kinase
MKEIDELVNMALNIVEEALTAKKKDETRIYLKSLRQILNQIKQRNDKK